MGRKTNYLKTKILNQIFHNEPFTPPSAVYLGLMSTVSYDDVAGLEITGNNYKRVALNLDTFLLSDGYDGYDGYVINTQEILFDQATPSGWGSIVSFGIFDSETDGYRLYWGNVNPTITVQNEEFVKIQVGQIKITET